MEWRDDGIVLKVRKHGENGAIVSLITRAHGRHAGLVRGGRSSRLRGILQPGNLVRADWRARLADHLGNLSVEPLESRVAPLLLHPGRLAALTSACAILETALPERQPALEMFELMDLLTRHLGDEDWAATYIRWEAAMLGALGYGLDLSACAATGVTENLTHVSPKTGRAVSEEAAGPYKERLLPLPTFLLEDAEAGRVPDPDEIREGLRLTGFFLDQMVMSPAGRHLPDERGRI
ncbi:DNA repair protein RecO [Hwanghaeella sp.]|uniref:DNA repair protein RecO n=1 Tax=Hwanghaeella sp. TaxID=2605943 RepID=UPI003CCBD00C